MPLTIYDYDLKTFNVPLFYDKLKELSFLVDLGDQFSFRMIDTNYYILLTFSGFVWVYAPQNEEPEIISLDELIEVLPEGLVEHILFNLDLFKQEKIGRHLERITRKKNDLV